MSITAAMLWLAWTAGASADIVVQPGPLPRAGIEQISSTANASSGSDELSAERNKSQEQQISSEVGPSSSPPECEPDLLLDESEDVAECTNTPPVTPESALLGILGRPDWVGQTGAGRRNSADADSVADSVSRGDFRGGTGEAAAAAAARRAVPQPGR